MSKRRFAPSKRSRFVHLPSRPVTLAGLLFAMGGAGLLSAPASSQGLPAGGAREVTPTFTPPVAPSTTILPTDTLPLPQVQNRLTFAENLQLRILQRLPSRFYFTSSTETTFRLETNPFQFPTKRRLERELGSSFTNIDQLSFTNQEAVRKELRLPAATQTVFRVLPNITAGFTLTPHTRLYGNYFMIRDSLFKSTRLNTTINSVSYGLQQDIPIGSRANLQLDMQARELYQAHQHNLFDFLPGMTLSYVMTPRTVGFVNALLQMRGNEYYQAPRREMDPFYTWGVLHQRGRWSFSASTTFVQNFREPYHEAIVKQDNYAFISDFEIARRLFPQVPGLQGFIRAEPIWNFHSRYKPGLAGMDFRLFYGVRLALTKPSLTAGLEQLKQQIEEQEGNPKQPSTPQQTKPSAYLMPYQVIADSVQPIHGFINSSPVISSAIHPMLSEVAYAQGNPSDRFGSAVSPVSFGGQLEQVPILDLRESAKPRSKTLAKRPATHEVRLASHKPAQVHTTVKPSLIASKSAPPAERDISIRTTLQTPQSQQPEAHTQKLEVTEPNLSMAKETTTKIKHPKPATVKQDSEVRMVVHTPAPADNDYQLALHPVPTFERHLGGNSSGRKKRELDMVLRQPEAPAAPSKPAQLIYRQTTADKKQASEIQKHLDMMRQGDSGILLLHP